MNNSVITLEGRKRNIDFDLSDLEMEDVDFDNLHPQHIEDIISEAYERYHELPKHRRERTNFRNNVNRLVDRLAELRGFRQANYLKP